MKLTAKQINEIAQDLETGMKIFINKKTLEYRAILEWDDMVDPEPWEKMLEEIENEWEDFSVIEKMISHDAFRIMEDFVDEVADTKLAEDLIKILNRKSPFANFKDEIEYSDYRKQWFAFRTRKYEEYVKQQLEYENIEYE